jgi:hypothetical protein
MQETSTTLRVGDRAPDFGLGAANSLAFYELKDVYKEGVVVLEFLRGTW